MRMSYINPFSATGGFIHIFYTHLISNFAVKGLIYEQKTFKSSYIQTKVNLTKDLKKWVIKCA